jgi:hypothetical protein
MAIAVSGRAPVAAPAEALDLGTWVAGLTSDEYRRFSRGHVALLAAPDARLLVVESVGGTLAVHEYRPAVLERRRAILVSPASRGRLLRWLPVPFGMTWELELDDAAGTPTLQSRLVVELRSRALERLARPLAARVLRRHLAEELPAFAASLARSA